MKDEGRPPGRQDQAAQGRQEQAAQAAQEQRRAGLAARLITVGTLMGLVTMALYLVLYYATGVWQIGVSAGSLAVTLVILIPAWLLARNERLGWAAAFAFLGVMIAFGGGEMAWSGATVYNLISVILLICLVGSVFVPRRWGLWLAAIAVYVAWTLFVLLAPPISRYAVSQSPILRVYVPTASAAIVLVTAVQMVRAFRIGTIRTRLLIAFAAIALLVAAAIAVTSALVTLQSGQRQVMNQLGSAITLKEREIQAWLDTLASDEVILLRPLATAENAQKMVRLVPGTESYETAHQQLLADFQGYMQQTGRLEELFILDSRGNVVLSTDPSREGQDDADQAYVHKGLEGLYVSPPFYSPALGRMTMVIARPLTNPENQVVGVLVGRPKMEALNAILAERSGLGKTGETYLVTSDYTLVTPNWETTQIGAQSGKVETEGTKKAVDAPAGGSGLYRNYAHVPVVGAYRWLPSLGVAILAEQEQGETLSVVQTVLLTNLAVAVGAVLLALGVGLLITRSIARPLSKLADTSKEIAAGNLALSAEVEREDEIGTLAEGFNRMTGQLRGLIGGLEQRVAERTAALEQRSSYLQASAEVGHAVASILDREGLSKQVVELIRDRFNLYYVGLFLLDESGEWAVLHAGTGEAGEALLTRGHRLRVGEGMIGWSVEHAEARIALDVGEDAVRLATAELPETRSEAALPLRSRGRVLGALTVQSKQPAAFDKDSLVVLQTMADQVAVALDNARLFAESQSALEAAREAYGQVTRKAWQELLRAQPGMGFRRDRQGLAPAGEIWHSQMAEVMRAGTTLSEQASMVAPIKVRGQVIGVIDAHKPEGAGGWTAEEVEVMEMLADQLGVALEGARLFREARRHAAHEEAVRRVTEEMRRGMDVEAILQTTVAELGRVLGVPRAYVRLGIGQNRSSEGDIRKSKVENRSPEGDPNRSEGSDG